MKSSEKFSFMNGEIRTSNEPSGFKNPRYGTGNPETKYFTLICVN